MNTSAAFSQSYFFLLDCYPQFMLQYGTVCYSTVSRKKIQIELVHGYQRCVHLPFRRYPRSNFERFRFSGGGDSRRSHSRLRPSGCQAGKHRHRQDRPFETGKEGR